METDCTINAFMLPAGNTISYAVLPGQGNEKEFSMNSSNGILTNAVSPLVIGKIYKLYAVATDSGTSPGTQTSS